MIDAALRSRSVASSPLDVYGVALRRAAAGNPVVLNAADPAGRSRSLAPAAWCGGLVDGDESLLRRCVGPVLDVGCGPGRLAGALAARGHPVLGIDVSAEAVRLALLRKVSVLRRDVFAPLPGEGRWARVLLADGNIGIGGDPARLLRRCRQVAASRGAVLVELDPPGAPSWAGHLRLSVDGERASAPFPWAYVGVDDVAALARTVGLRVREQWTEAGRWFASMSGI
ncbi:Methyltransferase domain-containing protein [Micromonospora sediminicola]|uniref:Methyltransferase domain-containing protein n=1 Tax=Micromonospora sediminicola TaxID=946078 RepID=A0A1A9B8C1_9ACTN|nr:methyltransferase domain-containing protein [Micromonospora sediminicola]SBT65780.1 Methyltransferase domain-containing protein [Micromonospora sediminicola]